MPSDRAESAHRAEKKEPACQGGNGNLDLNQFNLP